MLTYLAGHDTRLDIAFAVHQRARFTFSPTMSHETGVKRIVRYLIQTPDKGIILNPRKFLEIYLFIDSDLTVYGKLKMKQNQFLLKTETDL